MIKLCLLSLLSTSALAVKCGTAITKDCLGETDVRYDDEVGYDLIHQEPLWGRLGGLYKGIDATYVGSPAELVDGGEPTFLNITLSGSRVYYHRYSIVPNKITLTDGYYASTFEKDGSAKALGLNSNYGAHYEDMKVSPFVISNNEIIAVALNGRTLYGSGQFAGDDDNFVQETYLCLPGTGKECQFLTIQMDYYRIIDEVPYYMTSIRFEAVRVETEQWIQELEGLAVASNITQEMRPDVRKDQCATRMCPTEEQWRTLDPYYMESPYKEPEASFKGGFIAGVVVVSFCIIVTFFYLVHHHLMLGQEERLRVAFATSIASTISTRSSAKDLSPDDLRKQFESIDDDHSGSISKEEFHAFITASDSATMDERDFDVLFRSIDINGDEKIDFSEFCAFFALIRGEFDQAMKKRNSHVSFRKSKKMTASDTAKALRGSKVAKGTNMEAVEESNKEDMDGVEANNP